MANSLAARAVADELEVPFESAATALAAFPGVERRFETLGEAGGIRVVDDYGHHPVEIAAVLKAARRAARGQVIAVVQPHRYSRLRDLFEDFCACFNDADAVLVADVYAAGEEPIDGIHRQALVDGLRGHGHRLVMPLVDPDSLAEIVNDLARPGDMVVCLGAGSISGWANALPDGLAQALSKAQPKQAEGK